MHLVHRRATPSDLLRGRSVLEPYYFRDSGHEEELADFWEWLSRERTLISIVVEDALAPAETRPVAFAAYVFVSDEGYQELHDGTPWLAGRLCRDRRMILDPRRVALASAGEGLNVCVLHHAYPGVPTRTLPSLEVQHFMPPLFEAYTKGYRIKDYTKEAFGPAYRDWLVSAGMTIRTETADDTYVVGVTRDESRRVVGARISSMFLDAPPRFGFSEPVQTMLALAATGLTDQELADALGLSLSTVKKRWTALYERVADVAPGLLGPDRDVFSVGRGAERRRRLLTYLQSHPEETNFVPTLSTP